MTEPGFDFDNFRIQPIVVTEYGDAITTSYDVSARERVPETAELQRHSPRHHVCNGYMERHQISPTHQVYTCRACYLRVVLPIEITRYDQLRAHFSRLRSYKVETGPYYEITGDAVQVPGVGLRVPVKLLRSDAERVLSHSEIKFNGLRYHVTLEKAGDEVKGFALRRAECLGCYRGDDGYAHDSNCKDKL